MIFNHRLAGKKSNDSATQWLWINRKEIIDCPFQPGKLKITGEACLKRHQAARRNNSDTGKADDLFHYFVSKGLALCERCPLVESRPS